MMNQITPPGIVEHNNQKANQRSKEMHDANYNNMLIQASSSNQVTTQRSKEIATTQRSKEIATKQRSKEIADHMYNIMVKEASAASNVDPRGLIPIGGHSTV